jgi:hypothetical protein
MSWLWLLLIGYGVVMFLFAPTSRGSKGFFWGHDDRGREAGIWLLSGSLMMAWIFAKSVTNAANLGATFGIVGGLAYAAYYLSLPVAGFTIGAIRQRHGVRSLAEFLSRRYGRGVTLAFLLVTFIRLFNEVWSNTAVVGSYFGEKESVASYTAAFLFTGLTLLYVLKGGMRTSLVTDCIQWGLAVFFLFLALGQILPRTGLRPILTAGEFTLRGGVDLVLVALLQTLSYPFHDPVLTDRGFLTDVRAMRKSFILAGTGGFLFILLSSWIGVHAFLHHIPFSDDAPKVVASAFGMTSLVVMNILMLSSAGSTLDSAFSSLSKWGAFDVPRAFGGESWESRVGKMVMIAMAVLGNLPLFAGASILKATTISGTMVMGLAPIFLLHWLEGVPRASFHLAFWPGILLGALHAFGAIPSFLAVGQGKYAELLGVNLYGLLLCTGLYLLPVALRAMASDRQAPLPLQAVRR